MFESGADSAGLFVELKLAYSAFSLNVGLALPGQGITALYGPSACGKTTLLRALAGLECARGRVVLNGDTWQDSARGVFVPTHQRRLGYVFQDAQLFSHLSVKDNLLYGYKRSHVKANKADLHQRFDELVALLGIASVLERSTLALSGGERQRVGIARALLTEPHLLLMDEPLSALDQARKAEVMPYLERLHEQAGIPIVYVTHALDEVIRLADHVVLMDRGRVTEQGPVGAMLSRLDAPWSQGDEASALLIARLVEHDAHYGMSRLDVDGLDLWVSKTQASLGQTVRARVLARDVSVSLSQAEASSILNILPATLEAINTQSDDAVTLLLRLQSRSAPGVTLLARITRRSRDQLRLQVGQTLFAQIKGVALSA